MQELGDAVANSIQFGNWVSRATNASNRVVSFKFQPQWLNAKQTISSPAITMKTKMTFPNPNPRSRPIQSKRKSPSLARYLSTRSNTSFTQKHKVPSSSGSPGVLAKTSEKATKAKTKTVKVLLHPSPAPKRNA